MVTNNTKLDSFSGYVEPFDELKHKLRLSDDWVITSATSLDYERSGGSWTGYSSGLTVINIEYRKTTSYTCPECSSPARLKQYRIRELHHVRGYDYDTILRIRVPQIACDVCRRSMMTPFPGTRRGVGYTIAFEGWALRTLSDKNVSKASRETSVGAWVLWDILFYRVKEALDRLVLDDIDMISVDETSFRKGHDYVTVVSDRRRRLVFMCHGKGSDSLAGFCDWLTSHGGDPKRITVACADMSTAFEGGISRYLPNASQVFDKFHVIKLLNDDMNVIRKRLIRETPKEDRGKLSNIRFTLFKRQDGMNEKDMERYETIRMVNPELALAYDMKESFCRIYEQDDKGAAMEFFKGWYDWVIEDGCREMRIRAKKLHEKIGKIVSWYDHPVTNAFAEGLNSKIQKVKADGCGFTNVENFIDLCYFRFGNLDISLTERYHGGAISPSAGERSEPRITKRRAKRVLLLGIRSTETPFILPHYFQERHKRGRVDNLHPTES